MIKLFISQPMSGKTDEEIERVRNEAILQAKAMLDDEVEIIDSWDKTYQGDNPVCYLGRAIEKLGEADMIVSCDGWERSRGCLIERMVAKLYDIKVLE